MKVENKFLDVVFMLLTDIALNGQFKDGKFVMKVWCCKPRRSVHMVYSCPSLRTAPLSILAQQ